MDLAAAGNTAIERLELDDSGYQRSAQGAIATAERLADTLEGTGKAAAAGAKGLELFDQKIREAGGEIVKFDRAQRDATRAFERWGGVADQNERSFAQLIRAENELDRAVRQGIGSREQMSQILDEMWQKTIGAADAANQSAIAMERQRQATESAQRAFNGLLGVTDATSGAARTSASVFEEAARAEEEAARAAKQLEAANESLRAKYLPLHSVQQQYLASLKEIRAAGPEVFRSESERAAAIERTKTAFAEQVRSINAVSPALQRGAGSYRNFGNVAQQAGFQVGDLAVQIASGQSAITAFIQQGTQLLQFFGPWGSIVGAAAAVFGALYVGFSSGAAKAEEAEKAQDRLGDALRASAREATAAGQAETILAEAVERSGRGSSDLTDMSFTRVSALRRQQEAALSTAEAEIKNAEASLVAAQTAAELEAIMRNAGGGNTAADSPEAQAAEARVRSLQDAARKLADEVARLKGAQVDLFQTDFTTPLQEQIDFQERLAAAITKGSAAVREVQIQEEIRREQARAEVAADSDRGQAIADLVRKREEATDRVNKLSESERLAAAEATRRAEEEKRLATQRAETIEDLELELVQQTKLREAHESGAEAVRAVTDAQEAYAIVQRLKLAGDSDEAKRIAELVIQINGQKRAIQGIVDEQRDAERQQKDLAKAANEGAADFAAAWRNTLSEIDRLFDDVFGGILEKLGVAGSFMGAILKDSLSQALNVRGGGSIISGIGNAIFGGSPASSSGGGMFGGSFPNPFSLFGSGVQNIGSNYALGGLSGVLFGAPGGTAASLGVAAVPGGVTNAATAGLFGAGGSITAAGALGIAGAALGAIALFSGMLGGNPSVGPVGIADFSPGLGRRRAFDVEGIDPFTSDNGGNAEGLRPIAEAIADLIADSVDRFSATINESLRFRVANYQGPESGSGRMAGFEVNAFINQEAERRIAEGLSQEQAIFEALRFAVQEAFTFDSATLAEAAANTAATTTEDLLADLDFADNFERLTGALDALGGVVNSNSLAAAQLQVAIQEQAEQFAMNGASPVVDALRQAIDLFPGVITETVTRTFTEATEVAAGLTAALSDLQPGESTFVDLYGNQYAGTLPYGLDADRDAEGRVILPGTIDGQGPDGRTVFAPGTVDGQDAYIRVLETTQEITEEVTRQSEQYAANLERIRSAVDIARAGMDLLVDQIAGDFEPAVRGPFQAALEQGQANLDALRTHFEDVNEQIREANTNFPGLNAALIDVNQTIVDAQAALIANLQADFRQSVADALDPAAARRQAFVEGVTPQITDAVALGLGGDEPLMRDLFRAFSDGAAAAGLGIQDIVAALEELRVAAGDAGVTVTQLTSGALAELRQDFRQQLEDAANLGEARIRSLISASRSTIDDAVALGLGGDVPVLRNIVTAFVDSLGSAGTGITGIISALDDLSGEAARAGVSIAQLTAEAIGGLRDAFAGDITRQLNEATGLGAINTINDLIDTRSANAADAVALGLDANSTAGTLFDAQLRAMLSGSSLADLNAILTSGQILDEGAQAILEVVIAEQALTAVRATEVTAMQSLLAEHQRFADAANDNARTLRQAALSMLTDPNLSPLSPLARLQEAISQRDALNALANDDDPTDAESQNAISRLPDAVQRTNELARAYYASSEDYAQIFADGQDILSATALRQESIEQQQLTALQDIEQAILDLGGSISSSTPADIAAAAGFNFGNHAERNQNIYNQLVALGLPTPSAFGGGQLNALRDGNPAVDALLRAMGFAEGGLVTGGIPGRDSVPAMLMPGERVFSVPHSRIIEQLAAANQGGGDAREFAALTASVDRLASRVDRLIAVTAESGTANMDGLAAVAVGIEEVRQAVRRAA